jgi:hypothetical protein
MEVHAFVGLECLDDVQNVIGPRISSWSEHAMYAFVVVDTNVLVHNYNILSNGLPDKLS